MISIAMATYNGEKFIKEQIKSIQRQIIQDFELVICDDCSNDETCTIIEEFCRSDKRIRLYKNEYSLGFKKNFAKAISLCKGDFIALSDQDDVWYENHLSELCSVLITSGKSLAVCDSDMVDSDCKPLNMTNFNWMSFDRVNASELEMADSITLWRGMLTGMNMMFTKEFKKILLPMPDGCNYHDVWISLLACFIGGICIINKPLSAYRRHGFNVTTNIKNKRHSRFRSLIGHLLRVCNQEDRMSAIKRIEEIALTGNYDIDPHFYELNRVVSRRVNFFGRFANLFYEIKNFKSIYMVKF